MATWDNSNSVSESFWKKNLFQLAWKNNKTKPIIS
jgi:hypothetical protein